MDTYKNNIQYRDACPALVLHVCLPLVEVISFHLSCFENVPLVYRCMEEIHHCVKEQLYYQSHFACEL